MGKRGDPVTLLTRLAALLLLLAPGVAHAEWFEASSTLFLVYAEGNAESVREFATRLERFDKGMRVLNGVPDEDLGPANRVTVYVVADIAAVQRLAGRGNIAGFYNGRADGSVAFTPRRAGYGGDYGLDAETILLHEYAHHFMMQNFAGAFPAWFVEGFAEFNATAAFNKDGSATFGLPANHRALGLASMNALSIETLLASANRKLSDEEMEATIYGRGWVLTHFLTFEKPRAGQLRTYLAALGRGVPVLDAARSAFGDLKTLDRELKSYIERRRLGGLRILPAALTIGPIAVRRLSAGEAAVLPLHMQSDRGVDEKQAKELVPRMRRAASPYPNDPGAQVALAEAEFDAGNLAEAEAAANRAIAVQPANVTALTYKGWAALSRATASASGDTASWKEVRRLLLAANRVDPNAPVPFMLFYDSFLAEGVAPTRNAVTGLLRAFELAPQDLSLRMRVARQYLVDGKAPEARAALAPVAYDPHGGEFGKSIQAILATLEEKGAPAALAAWNSLGTKNANAE